MTGSQTTCVNLLRDYPCACMQGGPKTLAVLLTGPLTAFPLRREGSSGKLLEIPALQIDKEGGHNHLHSERQDP